MIYPNPLNPERYLVLNSGFTYREYDYLNNARQVPKLPDWAIVDLSEPPGSQRPGRVVDAGFSTRPGSFARQSRRSRRLGGRRWRGRSPHLGSAR